MPGILISVTTALNESRARACSASSPPDTNSISHCVRIGRNVRSRPARMFGSSSTKRILFDMLVLLRNHDWKANKECRAFADLRVQPDTSSVSLNNHGMRQRQPLAGPFADLLGCEERFEHSIPHVFWDPCPGVGHADLHPIPVPPGRESDCAETAPALTGDIGNRVCGID